MHVFYKSGMYSNLDMLTHQSGTQFSTNDHDNDSHNCAQRYKGAWRYNNCYVSNLNGQYLAGDHDSYGDGINTDIWHGNHNSLKYVVMMIAHNNVKFD